MIITTAIMMLMISTSFEMFDLNIKGQIYSFETGKPIENVLIVSNGTGEKTTSKKDGTFLIKSTGLGDELFFSKTGFQSQTITVNDKNEINVALVREMKLDMELAEEEILYEYAPAMTKEKKLRSLSGKAIRSQSQVLQYAPMDDIYTNHNTEEYDLINENIFHTPKANPLSTFSIDVDGASYANVRRMINHGQKPYRDAVRIEEFINYFGYDYPNPKGEDPFAVYSEVGRAPWNENHQLVHIGLQGKKLDYNNLKRSNLVFLVDVSGSMSSPNKLPLLKSSLKLMINELKSEDRIAIVTYAGAAGLVLPSTPASDKEKIFKAINDMESGGSTAGGAGIKLAYKVAQENLFEDGNNRIILATDGDFNVGASSSSEMVRLIEEKRKSGIYLTITGFGMGNYKDGRMEQISNAGNGNYFYIDNIKEAKKVFVSELRANLFTIAKDVKIQVEFNPKKVQAYRLIGYENRKLNDEDFNDDKKDAGELGAGHTVTALYEIIPVGVESEFLKSVDGLKYQKQLGIASGYSSELMTVKLRYKRPKEDTSNLIERVVKDQNADELSNNFKFSSAVAQFGMLLRDSEFKSNSSYKSVLAMAKNSMGKDEEGYRKEFIQLVEAMKLMNP